MAEDAISAEQAEARAARPGGGAALAMPPGTADGRGMVVVQRSRLQRVLSQRDATTFLAAVGLFLFLSVFAKGFLRFDNLLDISRIFSLWCIVAVGETMLLIAREIDLSVGSHYAFLVTILGFLAASNAWNPWLASLAVLLLGGGIGLINGVIVTKIGLQSFIVTLGSFAALRGATVLVSGGYPLEVRTGSVLFETLTGGRIQGVLPWMSVWMLLAVLVGWAVLRFTKFGFHLYATGGNLQSARQMGIRTDKIKMVCFAVTGMLCGLIAIITVGWLQSAPFATGQGFELKVIAAVIVGGTALTGGRGSLLGTLFGAAILGMIVNGLIRLGFATEWEGLATGAVILAVAGVELYLRRRPRR
jgi:ribose transport system permease protein